MAGGATDTGYNLTYNGEQIQQRLNAIGDPAKLTGTTNIIDRLLSVETDLNGVGASVTFLEGTVK